jgi:hypothetical protein
MMNNLSARAYRTTFGKICLKKRINFAGSE